jgi:hypothetical protein
VKVQFNSQFKRKTKELFDKLEEAITSFSSPEGKQKANIFGIKCWGEEKGRDNKGLGPTSPLFQK